MARKEKKADLRDGMWESRPGTVYGGPAGDTEIVADENIRDPGVIKPGFRPQAEGQTTHQ